MVAWNRPDGASRAKGLLLGLSYGDALANAQRTSLADFGEAVVPQSTTLWSDFVRAEANAIKERNGFDGRTVATALVDAISESSFLPGVPGQTTRALDLIDGGERWEKASAKAREGGSSNFEPLVRNCALTPAFRSFPEELEYVTLRATRITSINTTVMHASAALTALLAELIVHDSEEHHLEILADLRRGYTLNRDGYLRVDLDGVHDSIAKLREDDSRSIADLPHLEKEVRSPKRFLRGLLLISFGTDDVEAALAAARNSCCHPRILTPLVGAIMGARFGSDVFPEEWKEQLESAKQISRLGTQLLRVDQRRSTMPSHVDVPIIHGRPIVGSTYVKRSQRYQNAEMLRPEPAPHTYSGTLSRDLTPTQAVFFDWEHRAHRGLTDSNVSGSDEWIRVPEYTLVDDVENLPRQDMDRLRGLARRACDNAAEMIELYEDTWEQTLHNEFLGEEGEQRISAHLGYVIRSINPLLSDLEEQLKSERLIGSWDALIAVTRLLVQLEDYMTVTSDFMYWSERDWEGYSGLVSRVQFATGAIRQAIEAIRSLVIRHPDYDSRDWQREGVRAVEMR